jgi:ArsR family transcriptional regulator
MPPRRISHPRAVRALSALAHDTRLKVHRLLVEAGADGLSAGFIARKLGMPASSLSFHLTHLQSADLVVQRRVGRSLISAVNVDCMDGLMAYLQENCCRGVVDDAGDDGGCDTDRKQPANAAPRN